MAKILVDREVLKQALDALVWMSDCYVGDDDDAGECASCHERSYKPHLSSCKKNNAITALKSVLAQQEITDRAEQLLRENLPRAEWQDKHIHPVGGETYQNWLLKIYLPVPLSATDRSPKAALNAALVQQDDLSPSLNGMTKE